MHPWASNFQNSGQAWGIPCPPQAFPPVPELLESIYVTPKASSFGVLETCRARDSERTQRGRRREAFLKRARGDSIGFGTVPPSWVPVEEEGKGDNGERDEGWRNPKPKPKKFLKPRASPPAHPEMMPGRVALIREAYQTGNRIHYLWKGGGAEGGSGGEK